MSTTFWYLLTVACLVWYSTITIYVGIRGAFDIKNMLARLERLQSAEEDARSSALDPAGRTLDAGEGRACSESRLQRISLKPRIPWVKSG